MKTDEQRYTEYLIWFKSKNYTFKPHSIEVFLAMEKSIKKNCS